MSNTVTQRQKVFWNMMGSLCNALSSMILAIIVNRIIGGNAGGIFAFAFSNAQLMYTIGAFEIRPLQSTDVEEKFSFTNYFSLRIITCIIMMIVTTLYVMMSGFDRVKTLTIWIVCMYKMVEAVADVFAGMFQQHDRIDLSGKTSTFRPVLTTVVFGAVLFFTHNLIAASLSMVGASALLFCFYDLKLRKIFDNIEYGFSSDNLGKLIMEALPLFFSAFINMYMNNAPKYAINRNFSDSVQNYYNIIFMPAFVINLFSLFAFRPLLTDLARYWNEKNMQPFKKIVRNILLWILLLTVVSMAGAYILGAQILGLVYGTSVMQLRKELVLVMLTGGISATATFLYYVITVMRKQRLLLTGYLLGFICALIIPTLLVPRYVLMGAVISCGISMFMLASAFAVIVMVHMRIYLRGTVQ
ncbi:MAG: lipopolysaccharide biosynthesis protein [Lachnospiraceae bacterium]|nr:lipopolysaccharide biosynthesis protein [Lachnospiraceae bacterium]